MYEFRFLSTKYYFIQINNISLDKNMNVLLTQMFTKVAEENIRKTNAT